jgi:hypothetical protein
LEKLPEKFLLQKVLLVLLVNGLLGSGAECEREQAWEAGLPLMLLVRVLVL